jgi:hypothetical protein
LLESARDDPNNLGIEHPASDIREWLFDRIYAPVILVIDHRGIVRFHARDFPLGPEETIEAAVQFALRELRARGGRAASFFLSSSSWASISAAFMSSEEASAGHRRRRSSPSRAAWGPRTCRR